MLLRLCHHPKIYKSLTFLLNADPVFADLRLVPESLSEWSYMGPGYATLVRIVIGQQVSTVAAASMWERFQARVDPLDPETVMMLSDEEMRALGLSRQKISYIRGLSERVRDGSFRTDDLEMMSDEEVMAAVTSLKGFGRWSGEIYLMFGLARPDIWPVGDLGIQEGLRLYHGREARPDADETERLGESFRPHRTAASLLLWYMKGQSKKSKKTTNKK